jgi:putative spermidine/putrescine transport system permease protein
LLRFVSFAVLGFLVLPMAVVVAGSVTTTNYVVFPPQGFTLEWYVRAAQRSEYIDSFLLSVLVGVLTAALASVLGGLAALGLARNRFPGRDALDGFFLSPLILPPIAIGIALLQFIFFLDVEKSLLTLVAGHTIITVPYVIRLVTASLAGLDRSAERAAANLGASPARVLWHVTLPLVRPGVLAGAAFAFIISFDNVTISLFLTAPQLIPLPTRIFADVAWTVRPDLVATASVLVIFSSVLLIVMERSVNFSKRLTGAGVDRGSLGSER